jgi:thioredoxin-like negative regulator of GroEL
MTPQQTPLTGDTFSEFVRAHRHVVIHFWAAWNGYDQMMQRLLESQIPEELRELVTFGRFDIDPPAHHELCRQHNVLNVPFLAIYRDGSLIRSVTGMRTPGVITEYLRELVYGPAAS